MFAHLLTLSLLLPYILLCNNPNLSFGDYFKKPDCGGYGSGLDNRQERSSRVWTLSSYDLWPNKVVYYSYISDDSDDLRNDAVYIDKTVGINKALMNIKRRAMEQIEAVTCIRFEKINPQPGNKWVLFLREGATSGACNIKYIKDNLADKNIRNLGKILSFFNGRKNDACFSGSYVDRLGAPSGSLPRLNVDSNMSIYYSTSLNQGPVGHQVHELLHVLGIGHTQSRPDRNSYITVSQSKMKDWQFNRCHNKMSECQTFGSYYDCRSVMHYYPSGDPPDMTPVNSATCDLSGLKDTLRESDIFILKKMYCSETCDKNNKEGGAQWLPILDCRDNYNLAVTPPDSTNSKWRTARFDPSNVYQLWRQDMSGRLINKGTRKAFKWDRYGGRFVTPSERGFSWSFNNCTKSSQESSSKIAQKLQAVSSSENRCLNPANRYTPSGSQLMLWSCSTIHPVNGCFKHSAATCENRNNLIASDWHPILDCRTNLNLAVTPPDSTSSKWRTSKFNPNNDNQLWRQDIEGRIINKATGKAWKWDRYGPGFMGISTDFSWSFNSCTKSSQESSNTVAQKLQASSPSETRCLNTANQNDPNGATLMLYPCNRINPVNGCFMFK